MGSFNEFSEGLDPSDEKAAVVVGDFVGRIAVFFVLREKDILFLLGKVNAVVVAAGKVAIFQ